MLSFHASGLLTCFEVATNTPGEVIANRDLRCFRSSAGTHPRPTPTPPGEAPPWSPKAARPIR